MDKIARAFELELLEQHWCSPNDDSQGGRLRIVINGLVVMDGLDRDTGVARTALALSRTLLRDHTPEHPVAEQLVLHDCGFATTLGACGIGANWWVRHERDIVRIDGVRRFERTRPSEGDAMLAASVDVPSALYAAEVTRLGQAVLAFAAAADRVFEDEFDRSEWLGWQAELRQNLAAAAGFAPPPDLPPVPFPPARS